MDYIKPEILAPAGSMEALKAAIYAGADAVYLGGDRFGARAYAGNFNKNILIEAIQYAHLYGVKVYLTINTLFRNDDIEDLFNYLHPFYQAGLDAVIVQDVGVMCFVHQNFPDLPIHVSTQMTITTKYAYELLKDYGVTRIVPARELSMEEIAEMKSAKDSPEVEVFVQGALCYCYSGQCLMSSMLGGRSGNRGRCAQTCRLPYSVFDEKGQSVKQTSSYILSPKDLCGLEAVPDLIKAGVNSFKIEGRMKKPEYVAICVEAYRKITDAWFEGRYSASLIEKYKNKMAEIFNRGGFTKGYYYQKNGKDMMSVKHPGNSGVLVGYVVEISKNKIKIELEKDIFKGDILVLDGNRDDNITLTSNVDAKKGKQITLNAPRTREIRKNQKIMRMLKAPLMKELELYLTEDKCMPLTGKIELKTGMQAKLTLSMVVGGEKHTVTYNGSLVQKATSNPVSRETVLDKVGKTGIKKYYFKEFVIDISEDAFYPLKELKELRRNGLALLEDTILASKRRKPVKETNIEIPSVEELKTYSVVAMVSDKEQYEIIKEDDRIMEIYFDLQYFSMEDIMNIAEIDMGKENFLVLPPIFRWNFRKEIEEIVRQYSSTKWKMAGIVVRNLDEFAYLNRIGYKGKLVIDYSLYTMNNYAAAFYRTYYPDARITVSVELNQKQMKQLNFIRNNTEIEVFGYQQLMISTQCIQNTLMHCTHSNPTFRILDRYNKSFYVSAICKYCYNLIYNSVPTVLFDVVQKDFENNITQRFHFTKETKEEVQEVLNAFFNNENMECEKTRGHYNRGVE